MASRLRVLVAIGMAVLLSSYAAASDRKQKKKNKKSGSAITLEFKARLETEMRAPTPAMGLDGSQLDWQARRVGVQGTAFKRIGFEVSRELSQDFETSHDLSEKTAWRDAYVDIRGTKAFNLEVGRFKLPFGREELTAETSLDFAHRSLAARVLSPGRDPGVMAHGRVFGRAVTYEAGYFTRDGDNARTSQTEGGKDAIVARVTIEPFGGSGDRLLAPLEIGVNAAESHLDNRLGLRGRTVLGDGVFFDRLYVNGARRRAGLDARWERGPVALSGEYIALADERKGMGFAGNDLPEVRATAWYGAGAWVLTGERKHGRPEPSREFLRGGFGAVEVAARVERLAFGTALYAGAVSPGKLLANSDRATTIGINWYLNHYVKVAGDVIHESIDDSERSPVPTTNGRFTSTVVLLQFRF